MTRLILLLFCLLLASCSHIARKDGPPDFYVDETKISNAVPKPEKPSRCGNMASYRVFGKRYYTLRSSKNYNEVGIASWYGTRFHSHSTSSGERYNMLAMTAAHKTLPLPTYVEVTNLRNQRRIIVKVNDRGPFEANRIIDLSYVAAKKLGMLGHGTAKVRVKAIDPYTYGKSMRVGHKRQPCQLFLQVGTFFHKWKALQLKQHLSTLINAPMEVTHPRNFRWYRVQIGPIKDLTTADKITGRLRELGIKSNTTYGA